MATVDKGELPKTDRGWQTYIANARPNGERRWLAMGDGLAICLEEGGGKQFQVRLRRAGDRNPRRINIGAFPAVSVAEARKRLAEAKSIAKEGRDPAVDHKRRKAGVGEVRTVGELVELYVARRAAEGKARERTLLIEAKALRRLAARLGDRLLSDVEPRDFAAIAQSEAVRLRRGGGSGRSANILLGAAKQMFKAARGWGVVTGANPVADLARPAQERARKRVLFDPIVVLDEKSPKRNETGALLRALRDTSKTGPLELERETRVAIYLALVLGMRASEVVSLTRASVDLLADPPRLTIVASKTKAGERVLPLPTQVVDALQGLLSASDGRRRFVFPARSDARRLEHLHPESLSRAFSRACAALKIEGATLHDLRRTCLSGVAELTGDDAVAERIAGHKAKSTFGRHYDQSRRLAPMRAALQAWTDALERMATQASEQRARSV